MTELHHGTRSAMPRMTPPLRGVFAAPCPKGKRAGFLFQVARDELSRKACQAQGPKGSARVFVPGSARRIIELGTRSAMPLPTHPPGCVTCPMVQHPKKTLASEDVFTSSTTPAVMRRATRRGRCSLLPQRTCRVRCCFADMACVANSFADDVSRGRSLLRRLSWSL